MLLDARLRGLQPFGNPLNRHVSPQPPLIAASASQRIQIDTEVVLSHRLDQQLVLFVLIARAGRPDNRRQLHRRRLDRSAITPLPRDQHVITVPRRTHSDRLQHAVPPD